MEGERGQKEVKWCGSREKKKEEEWVKGDKIKIEEKWWRRNEKKEISQKN